MPVPSVYADECVDRPVIEALRQRSFDILTALEAGRGEDSDESQLAYSTQLGRVLLSYNRIHFRRIHAAYVRAGSVHAGIVLIPQAPPVQRRQLRAAMMLDWLGTLDAYHSRLFGWNDLQQHVVRGFRLPRYTEDEVRQSLGWPS